MPDGIMQWFDQRAGEGEVARGSRTYRTLIGDVDPAARWAGARVHFDVRDEGEGERAVDVTLRRGKRNTRHQRRAGSLAGAHRAETAGPAPFARSRADMELARRWHPVDVVSAWAAAVRVGSADDALALYSSDAVAHVDGDDVSGRSRLRALLEDSEWLGRVSAPRVRGDGELVLVTWGSSVRGTSAPPVRCRVDRGRIVEQWIGVEPPGDRREREEYEPPRTVVIRGNVSDDDVENARQRVDAIVDAIGEPVWLARTTLSFAADSGQERPASAKVVVDVDGDIIRAHAAAAVMGQAIAILEQRLRDQLEHRHRRRETLHRSAGVASPGQWRRGAIAPPRPSFFERPVEERQLVRRKTFAYGEMTVDEAAFDLEQLDHDFYLFCELGSGQDAVIRRSGAGYKLTLLDPRAEGAGADLDGAAAPVELDRQVPATMTVDEALATLDSSGLTFVFFVDADTERGQLVYRRYDGHYGLITPE